MPNFISAEGNKLYDAMGNEVRLTGLNWFGLETAALAPFGLDTWHLKYLLRLVRLMGFNSLRIPFCNEAFEPFGFPRGSISYELNPELVGLDGLQILDKIVAGAKEERLRIILDHHRPAADLIVDLWYTERLYYHSWINDWLMLANRYRGDDTVVGADLHNEPHGAATWGSHDLWTDWSLAAEMCGDEILRVNPDWLIIVEGIEHYGGDTYWWGGNLAGVADHPVELAKPEKLVYSAHDYGPGVWDQLWFHDPDFPQNLVGVWDRQWGYIHKQGIAPVLVGEFGGRSVGEDVEGIWQRTLFDYIKDNGMSYAYWCLNPNSVDTGGLLEDDWRTINPAKLGLLRQYQWPALVS
ncbi:MAG: glycoside hydrolase family 5 protein [Chloroflexi bacterium]|nr:glycoside hydrolase family 5 protein [Chloroflexota bacterium]